MDADQEKSKRILRELSDAFQHINNFQHCCRGGPGSTFSAFKETTMTKVHHVRELRHLEFDDLSDMTENEWNNKKNNKQRRNKLGQLKQMLGRYADGGKCAYCPRKLLQDYSKRALLYVNDDHLNPGEKTDDPSKLARSANDDYVNERLDNDNGLAMTCAWHHDRGGQRGEDLLETKLICLLKSEPSQREDHRSPTDILNHPLLKLKWAFSFLDLTARGALCRKNACDFNTIRVVFDAWFSSANPRGGLDVVLADDLTRLLAKRWNRTMLSPRDRECRRMLLNLLTRQSNCCRAANEKVSEEAVQKMTDELTEEDYVCKPCDYCFKNLAPFEYYGVHGDHGNKKKWNPSEVAEKNSFEFFDEHYLFNYTCAFCHSIRTWHQKRDSCGRCYYTS